MNANSEFELLASIAKVFKNDYKANVDPWQGSPFEWIRGVPSSRTRGKIGEELVEQWCKEKGLSVCRCSDPEADLLIEGKRVEVKFSLLWKKGLYVFQQIRDEHYDVVICLSISPRNAHCWVIPKAIVWKYATPQHGGQQGRDTRWIQVDLKKPPSWLSGYGGECGDAVHVLRTIC